MLPVSESIKRAESTQQAACKFTKALQISEKSEMKTLVFFAVAVALSNAVSVHPTPRLPAATRPPAAGTVIMFLSSLCVHLQQWLFACFC